MRYLPLLLCLALSGCSVDADVPLYCDVHLYVGDTIDGTHGLCKWSWHMDPPCPIWGRPADTASGSPFGTGQPVAIGDFVECSHGSCRIIAGDPQGACESVPFMGFVIVRLYE
jgi:hypothetical protein